MQSDTERCKRAEMSKNQKRERKYAKERNRAPKRAKEHTNIFKQSGLEFASACESESPDVECWEKEKETPSPFLEGES